MDELNRRIPGIHHITAITGDARDNIDFYAGVLGLRMVKLTVNFDDPSAYHIYFGDELGRPGTALTFFAWPGALAGRRGTGQVTSLSFSIPQGSLGFWVERLKSYGAAFEHSYRFEEERLSFMDPDGLLLELAISPKADDRPGWPGGPIHPKYAIKGFHNATLTERAHEPTARFLTELLGFRQTGESEDLIRFELGAGGPGCIVDIKKAPDTAFGLIAVGTIHHIAWRAPNDDDQVKWRQAMLDRGLNVTPIIDRYYFRSIYFREPGGVIFEIATDAPGFAIDEPPQSLGSGLRLPPWMESNRDAILPGLPPLELGKVHR
jgi:catechol 2,3-dioxygenase-like lactoylglutathione lyase family enzyme